LSSSTDKPLNQQEPLPSSQESSVPVPAEFDPNDPVDVLAQRQPTRRGKYREIRRFDRTQLRSNSDGRVVGRDYAAHFFRWAWITRQIQPNQRILDVGCGQETPIVYVLMKRIGDQPLHYVGVDLNPIPNPPGFKWATIVGQFSFVDDYLKLGDRVGAIEGLDPEHPLGKFDLATNLEVIEHMQPADGKVLLEGIRHWVKPDGYLYLSTPVFDGKAAVNHLHEYTIPELQRLVESTGWEVEKRWGTFANLPAIKKVARQDELDVMERIGLYYNPEVQSVLLAPLYPDQSRNNLWVLRRKP
jgi:2-polyprenyl-3-methyl-5-hydroxy-6-metoxy-1,4-benzoquinol methylase